MKKISVILVVNNEERKIAQVIDACKNIAQEIIICDTGSTDATKEIALSKDCKVVDIEWIGYGLTKNLANTFADNDWILSLDGDEVLSDELQQSISNLTLEEDTIYCISRLTQLGDQWIRHSGWYPQHTPRLFEKDKVIWNDDAVHESLIYPRNFKTITLRGHCYHYSYKDVDDLRQRLDTYAELKAEMWYQKNKKVGFFKKVFGPLARFIRNYIILQGFRDGEKGLIIAQEEANMMRKAIAHYQEISSSNEANIS